MKYQKYIISAILAIVVSTIFFSSYGERDPRLSQIETLVAEMLADETGYKSNKGTDSLYTLLRNHNVCETDTIYILTYSDSPYCGCTGAVDLSLPPQTDWRQFISYTTSGDTIRRVLDGRQLKSIDGLLKSQPFKTFLKGNLSSIKDYWGSDDWTYSNPKHLLQIIVTPTAVKRGLQCTYYDDIDSVIINKMRQSRAMAKKSRQYIIDTMKHKREEVPQEKPLRKMPITIPDKPAKLQK